MSSYDPAFQAVVALKEELSKSSVPEEFQKKVENIESLMKAREQFCVDFTSTSSGVVDMIEKATMNHPWDKLFQEGKTKFNMRNSMMSGNFTGRILQLLVSCSKAKSVLEIGTFTGCSALMMAEVLPIDGTVTTCDFDPYVLQMARDLVDKSPHGKKITMLQGVAKETLQELVNKGQKFDFIFIDADKKRYTDYFNICLESLLAIGGTIVIDNAMFYGTSYAETPRAKYGDHTRKFNDSVKKRNDIYHVLMPVRDGIMLVRRKADMDGSQ